MDSSEDQNDMELVKVTHNSHDGSISEEKMDSKPFITKKNPE